MRVDTSPADDTRDRRYDWSRGTVAAHEGISITSVSLRGQPKAATSIPTGRTDTIVDRDGGGREGAPDFDVRDFGDYLVVVGAPSSAVRGALRLTHMEAGDDPHGDGTVWWPKEAPDA